MNKANNTDTFPTPWVTGVVRFHGNLALVCPRRMYALERMREAGAFLTTSESMTLLLCKDAAHPKFRDVQKLMKNPSPDSGLLSGH